MGFKTINVCILTDINVSNVHRMIADILSKYVSKWNVKFLNVRQPSNFFDDSKWYDSEDNNIDVTGLFNKKRFFSKLLMLIKLIKTSDAVICTGPIAVFCKILKKPYIYYCTGADLDQYAKYGCGIFEKLYTKQPLTRKIFRPLKRTIYQKAIKNANRTIIASYQFEDIVTVGFKNLAFFPHPLDPEFINFDNLKRPDFTKKIQQKYDTNWIFFSSTRHVWSSELSMENDYKGNDKVIWAFKYFLDITNEMSSKLFFIEKGPDVEKSKALIKQLELDEFVVWLPPMNRRKLVEFYAGAHACFDQFSKGCLALCAVESMACGSPTISYIGEPNPFVPFYKNIPPVINSEDPKQIAAFLTKLISDRAFREDLSVKSFQWVKKSCSYHNISNSFWEMICEALNEQYLVHKRLEHKSWI